MKIAVAGAGYVGFSLYSTFVWHNDVIIGYTMTENVKKLIIDIFLYMIKR